VGLKSAKNCWEPAHQTWGRLPGYGNSFLFSAQGPEAHQGGANNGVGRSEKNRKELIWLQLKPGNMTAAALASANSRIGMIVWRGPGAAIFALGAAMKRLLGVATIIVGKERRAGRKTRLAQSANQSRLPDGIGLVRPPCPNFLSRLSGRFRQGPTIGGMVDMLREVLELNTGVCHGLREPRPRTRPGQEWRLGGKGDAQRQAHSGYGPKNRLVCCARGMAIGCQHWPKFPGMEKFKGDPQPFNGKHPAPIGYAEQECVVPSGSKQIRP